MGNLLKTLVITIILISCNRNNEKFIINGSIEGIKDSSLIALYDSENIKLDSTISKNGKFTFTGEVDTPSQCFLRYKNEKVAIWIENVEINFKSIFPEMENNCVIKGGKEQELQSTLNEIENKYIEKIQKNSSPKEFKERLEEFYKALNIFGKKHYNSYVGLDILYETRGYISKDSLVYPLCI